MNTLTSCHLPSFTHIGTIMKDYRLQLCGSWDSNVILPFGRMIDYFQMETSQQLLDRLQLKSASMVPRRWPTDFADPQIFPVPP